MTTTVVAGVDAVVGDRFWSALRELCTRLDARAHVVHVAQALPAGAMAGYPMAAAGAPPVVATEELLVTEDVEASQRRLSEVVGGHDPAWTASVSRGLPGEALLEEAKRLGAYAVVVGRPAHGVAAAVEHTLTGSTARFVEKHAELPVVLLPTGEQQSAW